MTTAEQGVEMDAVVLTIIIAVGLIVFAARYAFYLGRLQGITEATDRLIRGISGHYEVEGQEIPEKVAAAVDKLKVAVKGADTVRKKCEQKVLHLWDLGSAMGLASWNAGFEAAHRWNASEPGHVTVDLTVGQLSNIRWLAHLGFEHSMVPKDGLGFKNQQEAENATRNIEKLEFAIPREHRDQTDPYALSFNRQTMIWRRWPNEGGTPENLKM